MKSTELRSLLEIIESCVKGSATSLSNLLAEPVAVGHSEIIKVEPAAFHNVFPAISSQKVLAVCAKSEGNVKLAILFVVRTRDAKALAARLLRRSSVGRTARMETSAIGEAASIIINSFLNALARQAGIAIKVSIPGLARELLRVALEAPAVEIADPYVTIAATELHLPKKPMTLHFLVMLAPTSGKKLLKAVS